MLIIELLKKKIPDNFYSLIKESSSGFIFKLLGMVLNFFFFLLVSKRYGTEGVGLFSLSLTFFSILSVLGIMGLDIATLKNIAQNKIQNNYSKLLSFYIGSFKSSFIVSLLLGIFIASAAPVINTLFFNESNFSDYLYYIGLCLPFGAILSISSEALRGVGKIGFFSFYKNSGVLLFALTLLILSSNTVHNPVFFLLIGYIIVSLLALFTFLSVIKKMKGFREREHSLISFYKSYNLPFKELLSSSYRYLLGNSLSFLNNWITILAVSGFTNARQVGIFTICIKLSNFTRISLIAVNSGAAPRMAQFYVQKDFVKLRELVQKSTILIILISLPIFLLFILFSTQILSLFGEEFISGTSAFYILVAANFFNATCGSTGYFLQMTGNEKKFNLYILTSSILNLILCIILVPTYGIIGGALSMLFSVMIWNSLSVLFIYKKFKILTIFNPRKLIG